MTDTPQPPRLITVQHQSQSTGTYTGGPHTGKNFVDDDIEYYWAVKGPIDGWSRTIDGEDPGPFEASVFSDTYTLFGGDAVRVHTQSDIDALRALLKAIEADLATSEDA